MMKTEKKVYLFHSFIYIILKQNLLYFAVFAVEYLI